MLPGPLLPLAVLAVPLGMGLLAVLPRMRAHALLMLPVAPLPALALAVFGARGEADAADILLGMRLGLDDRSALFLAASAFLWMLAGLFATAYMRDTGKREVFTGFWCLTLAGNLGVFLAQDAITFYASFTAVSLPAYILIVHEATRAALRAGRIYMILALIGETSFLAGLILAGVQAESPMIPEVSAAISTAPQGDLILGLLLVGLGIKAGLVPLHVWLPLAHPEAPTPASAVLSGAIVKAGLFGMIQFFPTGTGMEGWSTLLVWAGLIGAYFGILAGLTQTKVKAVLAYSTVSQMGLMIAAVGVALAANDPPHVFNLVALYAAHHGLAKGALFLSTGVAHRTPRKRLWPLLAVVAVVSLSVAGFPFTGGGATKTALKSAFHGPEATLVAASAAGTGLLLLRFWYLLRFQAADAPGARAGLALSAPLYAAIAAALLLPWVLLGFAGLETAYILKPSNLLSGIWPLVAGAVIGGAAWALRPPRPPVPPGDLVVPVERAVRRAAHRHLRFAFPRPQIRPALRPERLERLLTRWDTAGLLLLAFALGLTPLLLL